MKALFFKIVPYVTMLVAILAWAFGYVIYEETLIAWWEPLSMALILAIATLFLSLIPQHFDLTLFISS